MERIEENSLWISLSPYRGEGQFKVLSVDYKWGLVSIEMLNSDIPDNNGIIQDIGIDTLLKHYTPCAEHVTDTNNF